MAKDSKYKSPRAKLVSFFEASRDRWKAKHHDLKKRCKQLENQARAVEKSRMTWRQRAEAAEQCAAQMKGELEDLKFSN